jgi:hypothetical protein
MKLSQAAIVASLAAPIAHGLELRPRTDSPRVVGLPIERRNIPANEIVARDRRRLRRRQSIVEQTLDNQDTLYFANLTLGSPPQDIRLHIDTGSSDLWVNVPDSSLCESGANACEGGTYDADSSSTHRVVNNQFNISYVDGSAALGDYVSDTLVFGGVQIDNFQFGIGEQSSSQQGVLGIGYAINEVQVNRAGLDPYPNLPLALVNGGHIQSNAYTIWLNDLDASTGEILFGGVDTAKYQGELATMPVLQTYGDYYQLVVALTGITVDGDELNSEALPAGVLLDTGATLSYLPDDLVTQIYDDVQAVYVGSQGAAYATCEQQNRDATIDFEFSGMTIRVPYDELFIDAGTDNFGNPLTFTDGSTACLFGIAPAQGGTVVLGDTFLRSAVVVYDLANNEISLAQTVFNATASDVREIGTGTDSVPGATRVENPVTSVVNTPGGAILGDGGSSGGFATDISNPSDSENGADVLSAKSTLSVGALVALGALAFAVL